MTVFARTLIGASLALPLAANAESLGNYPSDATCEDARNQSYAEGFAAGDENGYNRGYPIGFGDGAAAQVAACVADPQGCGITLASCIPDASYGETEPNDNFITADPLTLGAPFWGQNYGAADQDWFYTETSAPNQNLIVNFSVPDWIEGVNLVTGVPAIWNLSVRDAAGNVFANFNTNVLGAVESTPNAVTYNVTLGLVGTYYIMIKPVTGDESTAYTYSLTAFLQTPDFNNNQPIVGFYDSEIEPNDVPSRANPLATGVSMYGLINLTFNTPLESEDTFVWGQGENDWYVYNTTGNEIITLGFCAKEKCGPGNWFIEVYDQAMAQRWEAGESRNTLTPLMAFNTDTVEDPSATYRIGLKDPGYYFMRVNHKRLFDAPCLLNQFVSTTSETGFTGFCECAEGNSCYIPADCADEELGLLCNSVPTDCVVGIEPGCDYIENVPPGCGVPDEEGNVEPCDTYQTQARCACSQFGGVVQIPENEYSSPYNFTWHGTKLPPNTLDTDAYEDYLNRPSPYN
ncbi:hypothetical protein G3480_03265 [Thiorhodococcus mannitoliphagus]|uniref:Peptidase C-terminal archaeal/bacterial domain-containing protein n=1 Tax=Thiorhodococcus mannitoliphagus TaxID=329406 RepID=A0A6P1DQY3_9GAMM|nr:hypothetical protein [Thiorhodococcus mannitoliphagus]NEX19341.1 hypothetical protein [Thiorhodococcus mannitoliphagus]